MKPEVFVYKFEFNELEVFLKFIKQFGRIKMKWANYHNEEQV